MYLAFWALAGGATTTDGTGSFGILGIMAIALVAMYFFMMRPNKKREKEAQELRNNLEVGDEVTTIGGVVGRVVSIKEDTFVLETAGERSRIRFLRGAIDKVNKLNLESTTGSDAAKEKEGEKKKKGFFSRG